MIADLAAHLWQSTVFALAAGLLTLAFRENRAKVRFALWLTASLKFFLPFSLLLALGGRLAWTPAAQRIATPEISFAVERIAAPFSEPLPFTPPASGRVDWASTALVTLWACGFLAAGALRIRGWRRVRAAVRASSPLDIPAAVEIRSSPGLLEPGVVGLAHPILLLPEGIADRLTPPQLEAVLAHELCHVRRRDNLYAAIHMVVEAVFWFHPLVWWIGARLVEERERACDEGVLTMGSEPRTYADAILNVCKLYVESPLVCVSGVTGANLKRRIEAIMTNRTGQNLNRAKKLLLACAGAVALAGPIALGILIGAGNAPAIHAHPVAAAASVAAKPAQSAAPSQGIGIWGIRIPAGWGWAITNFVWSAGIGHESAAYPQSATPQDPTAPANTAPQTSANPAQQAPAASTEFLYQDRRLLAMLFDLDVMTLDDQARARQAAVQFVQTRLQPADLVAVMSIQNGALKVAQDFTSNQATLESVFLNLGGGNGGSGASPNLAGIEAAANFLGVLPEKKALIYFASGTQRLSTGDPGLRAAITVLQTANVAFFPIDARGLVASAPAPGLAGLPLRPQSSAEHDRRISEAQAKFGSTTNSLARAYIKYGPPDQIGAGSNPQNPSQIWRYNYIESFHNNVELEVSEGGRAGLPHINWPPPSATYEGTRGGDAALAETLRLELQHRGEATPANLIAGLPGGHASMQTYPAGEPQTLLIPLASLSGRVDILAQIRMLTSANAAGQTIANSRDVVQASAGIQRTAFTLKAGSYICNVVVREQATGQMYGETIAFEVK